MVAGFFFQALSIVASVFLISPLTALAQTNAPEISVNSVEDRAAVEGAFFTFFARHRWNGCHIYQSDGTGQGTRQIFELWMGSDQCMAGVEMAVINDRPLMMINWAGGWSTTQPGLFRLRPGRRPVQLASRALSTALDMRFVAMETDRRALFIVRHGTSLIPELWRTNGTSAGTRLVMPLQAQGPSFDYNAIVSVFQLEDRWYMLTDNLTHGPSGTRGQLFALDLAARRIESLFSFRADAGGIYWMQANHSDSIGQTHAVVGQNANRLVFFRHTPSTGIEPWVTDGTRAGTRLLRSIFPEGPDGIYGAADGMVPFGNQAFFIGQTFGEGDELWVTDGTPENTRMVLDINPEPFEGSGIETNQMAILDGRLYFAATSAGERSLWVSDGSARGTRRIAETVDGGRLVVGPRFHSEQPVNEGRRPIAAVNGQILFSGATYVGDCLNRDQIENPENCIYTNAIFRYDPATDVVERVVRTSRFRCTFSAPQQPFIQYDEIGGEYQSLMAFGNELLFSATDRRVARPRPQCWNYDEWFNIEPWILTAYGADQVANVSARMTSSRPSFIGSTFCDGLC